MDSQPIPQLNFNGRFRKGTCSNPDCRRYGIVHRDSQSGHHQPPYVDLCPNCHWDRHDREGFAVSPSTLEQEPTLLDIAEFQEAFDELRQGLVYEAAADELRDKSYAHWERFAELIAPLVDRGVKDIPTTEDLESWTQMLAARQESCKAYLSEICARATIETRDILKAALL